MEHSNKYIFLYSVILVVVVAISLTVVAVQLKPAQEDNIRIEKMQNILASVNISTDGIAKNEVKGFYDKYIISSEAVNTKGEVVESDPAKVFAIDMASEIKKPLESQSLPIFKASLDSGESAIVFPLRGKGLWGPVWGYISLKTDYNTVVGATFDHKGETPGLGAEINEKWFSDMFTGKTIFDNNGKFTSIQILKGGAKPDNPHGVDAISGGTITSHGVENMIKDNLESYQEYFKKMRDQ